MKRPKVTTINEGQNPDALPEPAAVAENQPAAAESDNESEGDVDPEPPQGDWDPGEGLGTPFDGTAPTEEPTAEVQPAAEPEAPAPIKEKPAVEEPRPVRTEKCREYLSYRFTDEELKQISRELAQQNQQEASINQQKAAANSQFSAQVKECQAKIARLSGCVREGSEQRMIDCETHMHDPIKGRKTTYRTDTWARVREERMDTGDFQDEFAFNSK